MLLLRFTSLNKNSLNKSKFSLNKQQDGWVKRGKNNLKNIIEISIA